MLRRNNPSAAFGVSSLYTREPTLPREIAFSGACYSENWYRGMRYVATLAGFALT